MFGQCCNSTVSSYKLKSAQASVGGYKPMTYAYPFAPSHKRLDNSYSLSGIPLDAYQHCWRSFAKVTVVLTSLLGYTKTVVREWADIFSPTYSENISYSPSEATFNSDWHATGSEIFCVTSFSGGGSTETLSATAVTGKVGETVSETCEDLITDAQVWASLQGILDAQSWGSIAEFTQDQYPPPPQHIPPAIAYKVPGQYTYIHPSTSLTPIGYSYPRTGARDDAVIGAYAYKCLVRNPTGKTYHLQEVYVVGDCCLQTGELDTFSVMSGYVLSPKVSNVVAIGDDVSMMMGVGEAVSWSSAGADSWCAGVDIYTPSPSDSRQSRRLLSIPYKMPLVRTVTSGGQDTRYMDVGAQLNVAAEEDTDCPLPPP